MPEDNYLFLFFFLYLLIEIQLREVLSLLVYLAVYCIGVDPRVFVLFCEWKSNITIILLLVVWLRLFGVSFAFTTVSCQQTLIFFFQRLLSGTAEGSRLPCIFSAPGLESQFFSVFSHMVSSQDTVFQRLVLFLLIPFSVVMLFVTQQVH